MFLAEKGELLKVVEYVMVALECTGELAVQPQHRWAVQHSDHERPVVAVPGSTEEMVRDVWHRLQLWGLASILHSSQEVPALTEPATARLHKDQVFQVP